MVDRRVTDGKRIGQLLASELTGMAVGALADVSVVDADPDTGPTPTGAEAYRVAHDGAVVASVWLYPGYAELRLENRRSWPDSAGGTATTVSGDRLRVESGVGVKRAVDALRELLR